MTLKKLLLTGTALAGLTCSPVLAQGVPQTRANMTAEIGTLFPSSRQTINAANVRTAFYDLIQSTSAIYHDVLVNLTGALVLGNATGGARGSGTLNAQGLYVNGVSLQSSINSQPTQFKDYGTPGSTDDTPAFNSFINACAASTVNHECFLNPGQYNFTTRPACLHGQLNLHGDTLGGTVMFKNWNEADPTKGLIRFCDATANDSVVHGIGLYGKAGTTGGALIEIVQGSAGSPIGFLTFRDINISTTGSCTQDYGIYENGTFNTVAPVGARDITFDNVSVFGAGIFSVSINGGVGVHWTGGGVFPAGCVGGGTGAMNFGGTAGVNSNNVIVLTETIQGGLVFSFTNSATLITNAVGAIAGTAVTNTVNADHVTVMATSYAGSIQNNWTNSSAVTTGAIPQGLIQPALGGTGVNNASRTITVSTGNVLLNPSSNGLASWQSGSLLPYSVATLDVDSSNPAGTTSTAAFLMMGLGSTATITPGLTTRVGVAVSGDVFNSNAIGNGAIYQIRYGTGSAPANAAAQTGTACGSAIKYVASTTAGKVPFSSRCIMSGLTPGTPYWIDLALEATTAGTATVNDVHWTANEF